MVDRTLPAMRESNKSPSVPVSNAGGGTLMIVGMRDLRDGLARYCRSRVSAEGAYWLLMMDGLFLIPAMFAFFFYPWQTMITVGVFAIVSGALIEGLHVARTHRFGWRRL